MRSLTFVTLAVGILFFFVDLFARSGAIWIGFAFLVVASALGLWVKWGRDGWGWGWELRRNRRN